MLWANGTDLPLIIIMVKNFIFFFEFAFPFLFSYFCAHCVFITARLFSGCGEHGVLFIVVHRLLVVVASLFAEHML